MSEHNESAGGPANSEPQAPIPPQTPVAPQQPAPQPAASEQPAAQSASPQGTQPKGGGSFTFDLNAKGNSSLLAWWGWAFAGFGILVIFAAALPWVSVGVGNFGISVNGYRNDGILVVLLAIAAGVMGAVFTQKLDVHFANIASITNTVLTGLATLIMLINFFSMNSKSIKGMPVEASLGFGFFLTLLLCAGACGLAIWGLVQTLKDKKSA